MSTLRDIQSGLPQVSIMFPTLYSLYMNDTSQTPGVYLGLLAEDTCIYVTDREDCYVLKKLQRGLSAIETWCERWSIKSQSRQNPCILRFS
jgi:hypothetical protein